MTDRRDGLSSIFSFVCWWCVPQEELTAGVEAFNSQTQPFWFFAAMSSPSRRSSSSCWVLGGSNWGQCFRNHSWPQVISKTLAQTASITTVLGLCLSLLECSACGRIHFSPKMCAGNDWTMLRTTVLLRHPGAMQLFLGKQVCDVKLMCCQREKER